MPSKLNPLAPCSSYVVVNVVSLLGSMVASNNLVAISSNKVYEWMAIPEVIDNSISICDPAY